MSRRSVLVLAMASSWASAGATRPATPRGRSGEPVVSTNVFDRIKRYQ